MNRDTLALALSTVAVVPAVFGMTMPSLTDTHRQPADTAARQSHGAAVVVAGGLSVAAGVAARSPLVAVAGLTATAVFAALYGRAIAA